MYDERKHLTIMDSLNLIYVFYVIGQMQIVLFFWIKVGGLEIRAPDLPTLRSLSSRLPRQLT